MYIPCTEGGIVSFALGDLFSPSLYQLGEIGKIVILVSYRATQDVDKNDTCCL